MSLLLALALLLRPAFAQAAPTAPPAEEPPPLTVMPELVAFVQAPYPPEALAQGLQGGVLLELSIDAAGAVNGVTVLRGLGLGLDEAAVAAAQQFRFKPAEDATGPVPVIIEFEYGFVLDAAATPEALPQPEAAPAVEAPINLDGQLIEMGTKAPVANANLVVVIAGQTCDTSTDAEGRWSCRGLPVGKGTLRAALPGYQNADQEVEVVAGQLTTQRVWIRNLSYRDNETVGLYRKPGADVTRRTLTVEEVRRVPGTFGDPIRVIQNLPGAARAPLGTGLLVIRGANPEDSGVYIDGIRIPLIYHLGGYSSVVNADLVEAVDYLPGGYGVEYGRSMGGVVDVRTKETFPEKTRVVMNADVLDAGALIEGRMGEENQLGYAAAARRSYIDVFIPYLVPDAGFVIKPRWYDYQLKVVRLRDGGDKLAASIFGFQDKLVASTPAGFAQGTDADTQGDLGSTYTTHRAYVRWEHAINKDLTFRTIPSFGYDGAAFKVGESFDIAQGQWIVEGRAEFEWRPNEALTLTPGLDLIGGFWDFETTLAFDPGTLGEYDPLAEREPWTAAATGQGWGPDLYLDAQIRPFKDRDRLLLVPGVRLNYVRITDSSREEPVLINLGFDPRLQARAKVTDTSTIKGGVGLYHQPPQPFEAWRPEGTVELEMETALATEIGWEQLLGDAISADGSLFYKKLDELIVENPTFTSMADPFFLNAGVGRIYGAELIVRHAPVHRFFGWVSYTLSRSERNDGPDSEGEETEWYPFDFDQTHIFVGVAGYKLPFEIEVSAKTQYVTGNPYTPYAGGVYDIDQDFYFGYADGERNSARLPSFVAVDLRIDKLFTFKAWQLETYIDFLNAIRGENPEFTLNNYDFTESRYIRGLPFIPSPGFQAEFYF